MRSAITVAVLGVVFLGLLISRAVPNAPAKSRCSNSSLHGSYGLHATGTTPAGPIAIVGVISYDGAGNLTGTLFARRTGSTSTEVIPLTGPYTVNTDCTVSDTFGNSQHTSVIVDDGRGYFILNTTEGAPVVISGEARKQFTRHHDEDDDE